MKKITNDVLLAAGLSDANGITHAQRQRLINHIEAGKAICLSGAIFGTPYRPDDVPAC